MTLQLRPTFSESWYRVKTLKAKLRSSAQISRQFYRGERWYVVRDPAGNQYHRLSDPAYRFVGLLDGNRTVEEAWGLAGGQLEDDAPTQPEVIQILTHLFSANLIDADVTPDATVLLRRHKQLTKRKMQNRLMNIMFPRIPFWDPDAFLKLWMPIARILFSKVGAVIWLAVVGTAVAMLTPYWHSNGHGLQYAAKHAIDLRSNTVNVVYMYAVFVFVKLIHELGHAFSCRRFGGECHELGVMFLVFVPTPYVDASAAWSFSNKWHRIFVGAAGMIVELFFASLMAFVWMSAGDVNSLQAQLAFNAMLVASVTTLLFNANPLLRYDGYYILSDYLEIPNLRQKSTEYSMGLIKRYIFRIKLTQPLPSPLQRFWLFFYAIASSIYRVFVGVLIIVMVAFQIPILGILMSIGGIATWLIVPVYKLFKYLALDPELHRKRGRAAAFSILVAALLVGGIGFIPAPLNVDQLAMIDAAQHDAIYAYWPGFVTEVHAVDGQRVKKGDVILVTEDMDMSLKLRQTEADLKLYEDKLAADVVSNPDLVPVDTVYIEKYRALRDQIRHQQDQLTIRAPIDGKLTAPELKDIVGRRLTHNQQLGIVQDDSFLVARVLLEQGYSQLVTHKLDAMLAKNQTMKTEIRLVSDISTVIYGGQPHAISAGSDKMPSASLGQAGGEATAVNPKDPTKAQSDQFEVDVPLSNPNGQLMAGQKAHVRFKLDREPLGKQWWRRILQVIQAKPTSSLV